MLLNNHLPTPKILYKVVLSLYIELYKKYLE